MKLGIVGSRKRHSPSDKALIRSEIERLEPSMLVSGGCKVGADQMAYELARELGIPITIYFPAHVTPGSPSWQYTRVNYARNKEIAFHCDALLALVAKDRKGGTENTIKHLNKLGNRLLIIR